MKKMLVGVAAVLVMTASVSFAREGLIPESVDGFRGAKWGSSLSSLSKTKGLVPVGEKDKSGLSAFRSATDDKKIGSSELSYVQYYFYNDEFSGVLLEAAGYSNCESLKSSVFEKFGNGYQNNKYIEFYVWDGSKTQMSLRMERIKDKCTFFMASKEINKKKENDEKQSAKKGAMEGF